MIKFSCKEWLDRVWPKMLVTYKIDPSTNTNQMSLKHDATEVPFQVSKDKANISFYAELEPNSEYTYTLDTSVEPQSFNSNLQIAEDGYITISNNITAIRLPKNQVFATPKPLDKVDGPIQGIKMANEQWSGTSNFSCKIKPLVKSITTTIIEEGLLFVEAEVVYECENNEYYKLTARVIDNDPAIRIKEDSDFKRVNGPPITVSYKFGNSSMNKMFWFANKNRLTQRDTGFENVLASWGEDLQPEYRNIGHTNLDFKSNEKIISVNPWSPWNVTAHYFGIVDASDKNEFLAFIPMHAGEWRGNTDDATVSQSTDGSINIVQIFLPEEHPKNLTNSGEFDADVTESYVHKEWALFAGSFEYHDVLKNFRQYEGYINLDNYKDWTLEWQEDVNLTYPRLMFSKEDLDNLNLDTHPYKDEIKKLQFVTDTQQNLEALLKKGQSAKWFANSNLDIGGDDKEIIWTSHYRQAERCNFVHWNEEILSSQHLSLEKRIEIRAHIAACCYITSNRDFNPRGSMIHLGTPNMSTNRFLGLTFPMMLIPDHPRFDEWSEKSKQYLEYKAAANIAPEGTWAELITYFDAGAPFLLMVGYMMHRAGKISDDLAKLVALPYKFIMEMITPPDPRMSGIRTCPGWGHEGPGVASAHVLLAAVLMKDIDPKLSQNLAWLWNVQGRSLVSINDVLTSKRVIVFSELNTKEPQLESKHFPGFGTVLRSHNGHEKETFLSYRQGYFISHSDANQCDFALYAKGVPLTCLSVFGYAVHLGEYADMNKEFGWHNRMRFGSMTDNGDWPGGGSFAATHKVHYGDSVDYLNGDGRYKQGSWNRKVVMVKSSDVDGPTYLIMRDSLDKKKEDPMPRWWYLRTLGDDSQLNINSKGFEYMSQWDVNLNVQFLSHDNVEIQTKTGTMVKNISMSFQDFWSSDTGEKDKPKETFTVTAVKSDDKDFVTLLCPLNKDEKPPRCIKVTDNVYKISTSESTDYIFIGSERFTYTDDKIAFEGIAGVMRLYHDKVCFEILEGPATMSFEEVSVDGKEPVCKTVNRTVDDNFSKFYNRIYPFNASKNSVEIVKDVRKYETQARTMYFIDSEEGVEYVDDTLQFKGKKGFIIHQPGLQLTRLSVLDGWVAAYKDIKAWTYSGISFDVLYYGDKKEIRVKYSDHGYMWMMWPESFGYVPKLYLDNEFEMPYATGSSKWFLNFPLPKGHSFVTLRPRIDPTPFAKV